MMKIAAQYLLALIIPASLGIAAVAQEGQLDSIYKCRMIADDVARLACFDETVGRVQQAEASGEFKTISRQDVQKVEQDAFGFSLPSLPTLSLPSFGRDANKLETATTELAEGTSVENSTKTQTESATDTSVDVAQSEMIDTTDVESVETATEATESVEATTTNNSQTQTAQAKSEPAPLVREARNDKGELESITVPLKDIKVGGYGKLTVYLENGQIWQQTDNKKIRISKRFPPTEATVRTAAIGSYLMRLDDEGRAFRVQRIK